MTEAKPKSSKAAKEREPNPFEPTKCKDSVKEMCDALNKWGKAWEIWGNDITNELDEIKEMIDVLFTHTGAPKGPGGGPADATKPPKPPFNP